MCLASTKIDSENKIKISLLNMFCFWILFVILLIYHLARFYGMPVRASVSRELNKSSLLSYFFVNRHPPAYVFPEISFEVQLKF